jgi:hypothetical protein
MNEIEKVTKALKRAQAEAPEQARQVMRAVAEGMESEIKDRAPKRTGEMARSIEVEWTGPLTLRVKGSDVAAYVEFGTKPHDIVPKTKPYLVFRTKQGNWVKTKKVRHPGTKPSPFIQPVVHDVMKSLGDDLGKMGTQLLRRLDD